MNVNLMLLLCFELTVVNTDLEVEYIFRDLLFLKHVFSNTFSIEFYYKKKLLFIT